MTRHRHRILVETTDPKEATLMARCAPGVCGVCGVCSVWFQLGILAVQQDPLYVWSFNGLVEHPLAIYIIAGVVSDAQDREGGVPGLRNT